MAAKTNKENADDLFAQWANERSIKQAASVSAPVPEDVKKDVSPAPTKAADIKADVNAPVQKKTTASKTSKTASEKPKAAATTAKKNQVGRPRSVNTDPEEGLAKVSFLLPKETFYDLKRYCLDHRVNVSEMLRQYIESTLYKK